MAKSNYFRKTARYNGKQYEAYGTTELEAMTKLADKLAVAKRGEEAIGGAMTVDAWFNQWLTTYKEPKGMTPKSLGMYREKYTRYIKPRIGRLKLKDVKDIHLQKIMNEQAGMSSSHVKKVCQVLKGMFKRARQSRLIPYDPSELLELPATTTGTHRSITDVERAAILEVAKTSRAGLWVLTMLYTGMRPGETAALTWNDVDFGRNEIHVHAAAESGTGTIKGPKTAAGVRDIPIHSQLLPLLLAARGKPFSPVFPTQRGNIQNSGSIRRLWTGFRRELDIYMGAEVYRNQIIRSVVAPDLTPYCLRHTFCTDLQRAGVPLNVAKELMGHSDISTTANIYTHRDRDVLHAGIALLDGSAGTAAGTAGTAPTSIACGSK